MLCECLSMSQLDDCSTWIKLGMVLKSLGAPLSIWQSISMKSNKFKINDNSSRWDKFNVINYSIGSLIVLAKQGDVDKLNLIKPMLYNINEMFDNGVEYPSIDIDTP